VTKKCAVCGKDFQPYKNSKQVTCSRECANKRKRQYQLEYVRGKRTAVFCKFCGKEVEQREVMQGGALLMHEECVIADCLATLKAGQVLSNTQYKRAYVRGYDMRSLREMAGEEDTEYIRKKAKEKSKERKRAKEGKAIHDCFLCGEPVVDYPGYRICKECTEEQLYNAYYNKSRVNQHTYYRIKVYNIDSKAIMKQARQDRKAAEARKRRNK